PYRAGTRGYSWIKLKRDYQNILGDTVDVVVVGAYKGQGHKAQFGYSSFLCAVYDKKEDVFKTISKVSTGFTEKRLIEFNTLIKPLLTKRKPARVDSTLEPHDWLKPEIVIEVKASELTRSTMHTAKREDEKDGYALRFPRFKNVRDDKNPEDATTVKEIRTMFKNQKTQKIHAFGG
ncbi:MAG: DNA ligase, partial [Candidatus Diapherotrites archaeon]|nr:DNA ligase [Candidatus Diapherotrites archaeon]